MQRKEIILIGVLIVLGVTYAIFFTDWFARREMHITASMRPVPGIQAGTPLPVMFKLNRSFELTSLKVVPLNGSNYDHNVPPIWHLVAASNSYPVKFLEYGVPVRGMHADIPKARPEPLELGKQYRLIVEARNYTGSTDFHTIPMPSRR